jgi:hypothetical protein
MWGAAGYPPARLAAYAGVLLTPYSTLLVEVLAVLGAGLLLQRRFGGTVAAGVLTVGLALVLVFTATGVWQSTAGGGDVQRAGLVPPPGVTYEEKCLVDQSTPQLIELTRLLRERMPSDAVYTGVDDTCVAYQLLPRVPARPGQAADWEVFTEELPAEVRGTLRAERGLPQAERTVVATSTGLGARQLTGGTP